MYLPLTLNLSNALNQVQCVDQDHMDPDMTSTLGPKGLKSGVGIGAPREYQNDLTRYFYKLYRIEYFRQGQEY